MKISNLSICLRSSFIVIPFGTWFIIKDSLPENVPIHLDEQGSVALDAFDRDRCWCYYVPLASFIKRIDPKRNAQLNEGTALKIAIGVLILITGINLLILIPKSAAFNITTTVFVMVSLLFTFLGNLMYNIKPNYFIGIRLPWTLENENNWKLTHRLAGVMWFVGGILCAILALLLAPKSMFCGVYNDYRVVGDYTKCLFVYVV
ncbi:MAG: SdpI family protein [Bacteroidota bacterium]